MSDAFAASLGETLDEIDEEKPVVEFTDVHLSFSGVKAINGGTFTVGAKELFAIIGPNGAGKTSIFNVLSGVYRPQQGTVTFLGADILGKHPHEIAAMGMSRTFQNIELFENLTVLDNLMLGRHHHVKYGWVSALWYAGKARNEEIAHRAVVEDLVDFLEIQEYRKFPVGLLPYGIQKRVELGRALAMEPKLLLLDEPVAGMNVEETEDMARFILDIRDELGIPMILVEHDMGLVMDLADRVMVVDFGTPLTTGRPADVQRNPEVIKAYLGQDHAVDTAGASPADGPGGGDAGEGGATLDTSAGYGRAESSTTAAPPGSTGTGQEG